jgi:hypothetical protein
MNERRGRRLLEPWMAAALATGEPALKSFVTRAARRPGRRRQRAQPALELRRRRRPRQPHQDAQTTNVRTREPGPTPPPRPPRRLTRRRRPHRAPPPITGNASARVHRPSRSTQPSAIDTLRDSCWQTRAGSTGACFAGTGARGPRLTPVDEGGVGERGEACHLLVRGLRVGEVGGTGAGRLA